MQWGEVTQDQVAEEGLSQRGGQGDRHICDLGARPSLESNPGPFSLQADALSTEPHQLGLQLVLKHLDVFLFQLWINRITAASQEHGLHYPAFVGNLIKCQVELNRKVLADLAIYEPKTFKSLAALAKRRREEGFAAALGDGKEPEGIFSRVVQYH
ncbi:PREDICTED: 39S ribosomal protein L20, mitochondrial [Myotis brandtii]|uniref:39S ribosomal protein L20, mitochondrial n=1 Tax=Myotis brandtii TaxID=109478 RepID=UPI000703C47A|nr:PREDICTED: 39S ribosomal protein L20, mitochondrial [Myotis brandtii]